MSLPIITATGEIRHGKLHIHNRPQFDEVIAHCGQGWQVELELYRLRATRSRQQDGYYFGCVLRMLAEKTGLSVVTLHDMMKVKFLTREEIIVDTDTGEVIEKVILGKSIRDVSMSDFVTYVDEIRDWANTKLGLFIPDPDPRWREHGQEQDVNA